jgi:hypothetical protein
MSLQNTNVLSVSSTSSTNAAVSEKETAAKERDSTGGKRSQKVDWDGEEEEYDDEMTQSWEELAKRGPYVVFEVPGNIEAWLFHRRSPTVDEDQKKTEGNGKDKGQGKRKAKGKETAVKKVSWDEGAAKKLQRY